MEVINSFDRETVLRRATRSIKTNESGRCKRDAGPRGGGVWGKLMREKNNVRRVDACSCSSDVDHIVIAPHICIFFFLNKKINN